MIGLYQQQIKQTKLGASILISLMIWLHSAIAFAVPVFSDTAQVMRHYDYESGLSQVSITAIEEDQLGYIWIGTQAGLNRFDGHSFKQFSSRQQDPFALAGAFITALCHSGESLWIGTSTGLSVYHTVTGRFQSFLSDFSPLILSDRVQSIGCQGAAVSVTTEDGFYYVIDKTTLEPQEVALEGDFIRYVTVYKNLVYYLSDEGLMVNNRQTGITTLLLAGDYKSLMVSGERAFLISKDNQLTAYDTLFERALWQSAITSDAKLVLHSVFASAGELFVATSHGVYLLDMKGEIKKRWYKRGNNKSGLQDSSILSVFRDSNSDLWIGTETRGLHFISQLSETFGHVGEYNYPHSPLTNSDVRSFALDESDRLWVATSSGGYIFEQQRFVKVEQVYPQLARFSNTFITKIQIVGEHAWLTSRGAGVARLNLISGEVTYFMPDFGNGPELSFNDITVFKQLVLLSSRTLGLLYYDEAQKKLQPFFAPSVSAPNHVSSLLVDGDGFYFGSVGDGLFHYDGQNIKSLTTNNGLASDIVFMLSRDSLGTVWVASESGISILNKQFEVEKVLKVTDGLANEAVWAMVFDQQEHIWLGTSGGLSRINIHDHNIDNFLVVDGVQDNEFNYNAAWLAPDGRVFIGGAKGFNQFYPEQIRIAFGIRPLLISNIELLGEVLHPEASSELALAPELTEKLLLNYDQDIVSLHYSSLDYGSERLNFFYRIVGLSDQWLKLADGVRQINLLKLEPGNYQVQTYTVNRFNQKSPVHRFTIQIKAPWWWDWYSKTFYIVALTLSFALWFRQRQARYRQVVNDNRVMNELQQRLELSLWASGDELWDWHLEDKKVYRYCVKPRIDYGKNQTAMTVEDIDQFVHPKDCIAWEEKIESCLEGELDTYEIAMRVKTLKDQWSWVLERGKVVSRDHHGRPQRIVGALKDIAELKAHQNALQTLNEQLEIKVAMRTDELYKKNQKLEQAMMELKRTQQELIESEKMASLGNVVAGIAHEINTPLGVAITALTYNQECLHNINEKLQEKQLRQTDLERFNAEQEEGYRLILRNLDRAQMLISNFKQVAVDQSSEVERDINVKDYIADVFSSLLPLSKGKEIGLTITGDEDMLVNTYPGAIYQIMTNLFNNSMIHGFEAHPQGKVEVSTSMAGEHWLLIYRDDGVGMPKAGLKTLFDPFVTTKRSQGGCGLGMHIVYNLVTQLLKGEISANSSPGEGIEVTIRVPYSPPKGEEMVG